MGRAVQTSAERRVVSILFVDLVGFTERSDLADPEDVRGTLLPFHAGVKRQIERFGGTLDKFIGDAALGVFGAPVAHEDDPERAVRAGLAIIDSVPELNRQVPGLAVRIAVNTGEAVVTYGSGPQEGEAVAGDVVNTASRMQSVAPRDGLVVGDATHHATRDIFEFDERPAVKVKGKAEPLRVWRVTGERVVAPSIEAVPLVGRTAELTILRDLMEDTVRERTGHLAYLVGEPGIGKTRLIEELRLELGEEIGWRVGRCVPYGDGNAFRALADVVRAEAAIEQYDDAITASKKLRALADRVDPASSERDWIIRGLEPLLGLGEGGGDKSSVSPSESAAAWSRVIADAAETAPMVVVFEDLHWAEPVVREMVGSIAEALVTQPVLLICLARPELLEDADGRSGGPVTATTIVLGQLTEGETSTLLDTLLRRSDITTEMRTALIERAEGNPLFTLEFARMLGESQPSAGDESHAFEVPDSVRSMVAARLDSIPADLRSLLQDASVFGAEFWVGALVAVSGLPEIEVSEGISGLVRRGLLKPERSSWFLDQSEFAFVHALIREVAYARIPRLDRARKHRAAGEWIEQQAGGRAGEHAETLANHFLRSVDLAEAAGAHDDVSAVRGPAIRWLLEAGDKSTRIDDAGALVLYGRALNMLDGPTHDRARALSGSGRMGRRTGELSSAEVLERFEEALRIEELLGDRERVGGAMVRVGGQLANRGEVAASRATFRRAIEVLEAEAPGPELARAYAFMAEEAMFGGRVHESLPLAERSLELARRFGADDITVMSLHIRGDARCSLGDPIGLGDLEEALDISEASGSAAESVTSENYLAEWKWAIEGPSQGLAHDERALALARRRGVVTQGFFTKAHALFLLTELGRWDEVVAWADELLATSGDRLDPSLVVSSNLTRSHVLLQRGLAEQAADPVQMLAKARPMEEVQVLSAALTGCAEFAIAAGDLDGALGFLIEFEQATRDVAAEYRESRLAEVARACVACADVDLAIRMVDRSSGNTKRDRLNLDAAAAIVEEAGGDIAAAAERYAACAEAWAEYGHQFERAHSFAGAARCLVKSGYDASYAAGQATELFDGLGVTAALRPHMS